MAQRPAVSPEGSPFLIVVMRDGASMKDVSRVLRTIEKQGFRPHLSRGGERTIVGVLGDERRVEAGAFDALPGVERVIPILKPYKLAGREFRAEDTTITIGGVKFGGREVVVMAGPCSVESEEQILASARAVKKAGARVLRGGAFKPRTSPYAFQGLGREGLELLACAREATGLPVVTEVMAPHDVELIARFADILQVGARNMQNFELLKECGRINKPILLKRGMMSTMEELLMSAEYILSNGNYRVMLCERGIRTFERYTRNTMDINAVPALKSLSHLPVIADPSHGTGKRGLVAAVSRASVAAGADGLIIEVHPHPDQALSDGDQSLAPPEFAALMKGLKKIAAAVGRTM